MFIGGLFIGGLFIGGVVVHRCHLGRCGRDLSLYGGIRSVTVQQYTRLIGFDIAAQHTCWLYMS